MVSISFLLILLIVGFSWYHFFIRMGFKGSPVWIMLGLLTFPVTALFVLIYLTFFPWPIEKELEKVKAQLQEAKRSKSPSVSYEPVDEVDVELDRMRGEMGYNQMKKRKPNK